MTEKDLIAAIRTHILDENTRSYRSFVGLCLLVIVLMVLCLANFFFCAPLCADTIISESVSPSGQLKAVVFERDCGATTATNTQICFRGTAFYSTNQPSFLVFEADGKASLSWKAQKELVIRLPPGAKVFSQETEVSGIRVEYEVK